MFILIIIVTIAITVAFMVPALLNIREAWSKLRSERSIIIDLKRENVTDAESARRLLDSQSYVNSLTARALHGTIDTGKVATEHLNWRDWISGSRYSAGIFVFVGLVFTVGGTAFAVSKLATSVAQAANDGAMTSIASSLPSGTLDYGHKLMDGIPDLLGGMALSSTCTVAGLIATLIISFLNSRYLAACSQADDAVEVLAHTMLRKIWLRERDKQTTSALTNATESLVSVTANLTNAADGLITSSQNFTVNLRKTTDSLVTSSENFEANLVKVADSLITSSENFEAKLVTIVDELQQKIVAAVNELPAAYKDAQKSLRQITKEINALVVQMQELTTNLQNDTVSMTQGYATLEKTLRDAGTMLQEDSKLLLKSVEGLSNTSDMLNQEREGLVYATNIISGSASRMEQAVSLLHTDLSSSQQKRDEKVESALRSLTATQQSMQAVISNMDATISRLPVLADMTTVSREISEVKKEVTSQIQDATRQVVDALGTIAPPDRGGAGSNRYPQYMSDPRSLYTTGRTEGVAPSTAVARTPYYAETEVRQGQAVDPERHQTTVKGQINSDSAKELPNLFSRLLDIILRRSK